MSPASEQPQPAPPAIEGRVIRLLFSAAVLVAVAAALWAIAHI